MMRMRPFGFGMVLLMMVLAPSAVNAAAAQTEREIAHLLAYIGESSCRFIRNGQYYDGTDARRHIQKKYDYARNRINTATDFIRYCAAQSSMSGRPYRVQCGDETMLCADWLHEELARLRQK